MLRRIESIGDQLKGIVTFALDNGDRLTVHAGDLKIYGLNEMLRRMGRADLIEEGRLPVIWMGRKIGTLPASFDPFNVTSKSFLYQSRPSDFLRTELGWEADNSLGPGDINAVEGFEGDESWHL